MGFSIKIRHRSPGSKPWRWEIYVDDRLVTASHESYATQFEAHAGGRAGLKRFKDNLTGPPKEFGAPREPFATIVVYSKTRRRSGHG